MYNLDGFRILVVEDDSDLKEIICDFLSLTNANVLSAGNGKEAMVILGKEKIDFVMSDIQMPFMDGLELLKAIRKNDSKIPIVLMATGQSQLTEVEAKKMGAAGLINKPFNQDFLLATVSGLLKDSFPQGASAH